MLFRSFAAGFAHARGRLIATSDGDLQNDPRDIPAMVAKAEEGYDIVALDTREIAKIDAGLSCMSLRWSE